MRTWSNMSLPLSTPFRPAFDPQSLIVTPAWASPPGSRMDQEGVYPTWCAVGDQLGEHDGQPSVARGVADVVLAGALVRAADDELAGPGIAR